MIPDDQPEISLDHRKQEPNIGLVRPYPGLSRGRLFHRFREEEG